MKVSDLTTHAVIRKVRNIILDSKLFSFKWSNENNMFLEIKLNAILDCSHDGLRKFKEVHKKANFEMLFGKIHVVNSIMTTEKYIHLLNPVMLSTAQVSPSKYQSEINSADQLITDEDFIYEMLGDFILQLKAVEMSIEVKAIVFHFIEDLEKTKMKYQRKDTVEIDS